MSRIVIGLIAAVLTACAAAAQAPTPPSSTPPAPPPESTPKQGTDLVVNPTDAECKSGWNASLKWTKEQFDQLCATMRAAK
jgi:Spy/CpxP family protein refolding chaperone